MGNFILFLYIIYDSETSRKGALFHNDFLHSFLISLVRKLKSKIIIVYLLVQSLGQLKNFLKFIENIQNK